MSYDWMCPRCGEVSLRHTSSGQPATCRHEHHAPEDCVCGDCRQRDFYGLLLADAAVAGEWRERDTRFDCSIRDQSGRFLTSDPHQAPATRPAGPWNQNTTGE